MCRLDLTLLPQQRPDLNKIHCTLTIKGRHLFLITNCYLVPVTTLSSSQTDLQVEYDLWGWIGTERQLNLEPGARLVTGKLDLFDDFGSFSTTKINRATAIKWEKLEFTEFSSRTRFVELKLCCISWISFHVIFTSHISEHCSYQNVFRPTYLHVASS